MRTLIALITGSVFLAAPFTGFAATDQPSALPTAQVSTDRAQAQDAQTAAVHAMEEMAPRAAKTKKHASKKTGARRTHHAKRTTKAHRAKQDAMRTGHDATPELADIATSTTR